MTRRFLAAFLCLAAASACSKKAEAPSARTETPAKPEARFYYDLGQSTVDVSAYPPNHREGYKLFLAVCGTCHGAARALNSPYVEADTWKRYLRRMHVKMEAKAVLPLPQDEERILEFLVYDSKVRKLDKQAEFQAQQEKLKAQFEEAAKR